MSTFIERMNAATERARERQRKAKETFAHLPKTPRVEVLAETVVEGKKVSEWEVEVTVLEDLADEQRRATGKLVVLDFADGTLPAAAVTAVDRWRAAGKPTEYTTTAGKLKALREEGEKHNDLALMEDGKAKAFEEAGNLKKAGQHRKYAKRERDAAAKFFAEAEALVVDHQSTKERP